MTAGTCDFRCHFSGSLPCSRPALPPPYTHLTCLSTVIFVSLVISAAWFRRSTTWKDRRTRCPGRVAGPGQSLQPSCSQPPAARTLSEVVMPSMPGPSSCVKNCDATLRRVTLSPLLLAMTAVRFSLEKKLVSFPVQPSFLLLSGDGVCAHVQGVQYFLFYRSLNTGCHVGWAGLRMTR